MTSIDNNGNVHDRLGRFANSNTPAAMFDLAANLFGDSNEPVSAPVIDTPASRGSALSYDPKARTLTLGRTDCGACRDQPVQGLRPSVQRCPSCDGSGVRSDDDTRACPACAGRGHIKDHGRLLPCKACGGAYQQASQATFNDHAPSQGVADLPVRVLRSRKAARKTTPVLSVTDHGEHWDRNNPDALVAEVRDHLSKGVRAIDIIEPPTPDAKVARLVPGLVITVTSSGYTVHPDTKRKTAGQTPTRTVPAREGGSP